MVRQLRKRKNKVMIMGEHKDQKGNTALAEPTPTTRPFVVEDTPMPFSATQNDLLQADLIKD